MKTMINHKHITPHTGKVSLGAARKLGIAIGTFKTTAVYLVVAVVVLSWVHQVSVEQDIQVLQERRTLHEASETVKALAGATQAAVVLLDADLRVTRWDSKVEELTGIQDHEVVGYPITDVMVLPEGSGYEDILRNTGSEVTIYGVLIGVNRFSVQSVLYENGKRVMFLTPSEKVTSIDVEGAERDLRAVVGFEEPTVPYARRLDTKSIAPAVRQSILDKNVKVGSSVNTPQQQILDIEVEKVRRSVRDPALERVLKDHESGLLQQKRNRIEKLEQTIRALETPPGG